MKIRQGFVSNSSSSSFVIVINSKPEQCPHCKRGGLDLETFMNGHNHWETSLGDLYCLLRDYEDEAKHDPDSWTADALEKIRQAQKDGKEIMCIDVSYHDEALKMLIGELKESGDIELLVGDD